MKLWLNFFQKQVTAFVEVVLLKTSPLITAVLNHYIVNEYQQLAEYKTL